MTQMTSPPAASSKWEKTRSAGKYGGGSLTVSRLRGGCWVTPPRASQVMKREEPNPAVTTHVASAATPDVIPPV